jgi:hypothetical protein
MPQVIKKNHLRPLTVYDSQMKLVKGERVKEAMENSLAEVTFTLKQFRMKEQVDGKPDKWYDCFTG